MTSSTEPQNPVRSTARLHGWLPAIFVSAFISLIIVSPFFRLGSATGHDFLFHISSWMDAAGQWKEGIFYPRWTEWANYGFGEPRFIFYPPFSWMLGAALGFLVPWTAVPGVFIALVQTFSGLSAFALARRILPERAALFCAACFVANPYALVIIYLRSDFAELLANAFFPLLFLAAFQICELIESPEQVPGSSKSRAIVFFAVVLAAIWLSNAPAGVIACYSSVAVFGFAALSRKAWQPLLRGAAGCALGLGLAGFYILPAAYEQRWVNIGEALASGLLPSENFLFTVINDPEHTLFNWIVSSIAIFLMVFAGVAALAAHRARRESEGALENRLWQALLLLAGLASALMFRFTSIFWSVLPKLRFVQFPWRWMAILAVAFAIFVGAAMGRKRWGWMWAVVTFAVIGAGGTGLVHQAWWYRGDIPILRQAIASGEGFEGTFEYDPKGRRPHKRAGAKSSRGAGDGHGFDARTKYGSGRSRGSLGAGRKRSDGEDEGPICAWASALELPGLAGDGEWCRGHTVERRGLQPDARRAATRRVAHPGAICKDLGPNSWGLRQPCERLHWIVVVKASQFRLTITSPPPSFFLKH